MFRGLYWSKRDGIGGIGAFGGNWRVRLKPSNRSAFEGWSDAKIVFDTF